MHTYPRLQKKATGSYRFIQTGDDTNGQLFQFGWTAEPGGSAPEHLHPHQSETFTVTERRGCLWRGVGVFDHAVVFPTTCLPLSRYFDTLS